VPPIMLRTPANPEGLPIEVFDKIRGGVAGDRSQYYKDLAIAFYGANRSGAKVSQGTLDQFWLWSMQAGANDMHQIGPKSEDRATGRGNRDEPMRASRSRKLVRQT